jgi:hypothetical protein
MCSLSSDPNGSVAAKNVQSLPHNDVRLPSYVIEFRKFGKHIVIKLSVDLCYLGMVNYLTSLFDPTRS